MLKNFQIFINYIPLEAALAAAAEANGGTQEFRRAYDIIRKHEHYTIERCAQLAKGCYTGEEAAIRIRALKDKP